LSGGLSRRGLFGAGLGRLLATRLEAGDPEGASGASGRGGPVPGWGETDSARLGARVAPAVAALVESVAAEHPGGRVLDATAGDGALAVAAARAGLEVVAVEASAALRERGRARCADAGVDVAWHAGSLARLPFADGEFDAVVSAFAATYHPRQRVAIGELVRVVRFFGTVAVAGWDGLMARLLALAGAAPGWPPGVRPARWNRFETAQLHFSGFEDLDVRPAAMTWTFAGEEEALAELGGPLDAVAGAAGVRAQLPALLREHGEEVEEGLRVRAAFVVAGGRRA